LQCAKEVCAPEFALSFGTRVLPQAPVNLLDALVRVPLPNRLFVGPYRRPKSGHAQIDSRPQIDAAEGVIFNPVGKRAPLPLAMLSFVVVAPWDYAAAV
jgi:hypothetical protein